nr:major capsid protein [Rattus norvegicus microvirus]
MAISDSGSNYKFFDHLIKPKVPRSLFDLSYLNTLTADFGQLIPVYKQLTLPNEDYTIDLEAMIRCVNPPVVPLASRIRVFFHFYYCAMSDLWKGWQSFATVGRDNDFTVKVPNVRISQRAIDNNCFGRGTLLDYLGFNAVDYSRAADGIVTPFNALSLMMYQRIYRDFYLNQNLFYQGDNRKKWFPRYDGDFRIDTEVPSVDIWSKQDGLSNSYTVEDINLGELRYRNFIEDYFTSSLPWPQRGSAPALDASVVLSLESIPVGVMNDSNAFLKANVYGMKSTNDSKFGTLVQGVPSPLGSGYSYPGDVHNTDQNYYFGGLYFGSSHDSPHPNTNDMIYRPLVTQKLNDNLSVKSSLTLAALRELNSAQRILEKMAHSNGSYGEFCTTFFGNRPASAVDHNPIYIGGTYQSIKVSEVLQVGGTQSDTVQGTQTGYAFSHSEGHITKFHSGDYGIIMGIMSIMPDTMYYQGLNRLDTLRTQADLYLPERAGLSPQAILNQELYYQIDEDAANKDMISYQNRFDELRYRANEVHGLVADDKNLSFFPYTQARKFSSLPTWSMELMTTKDNVRKDWLSAPSEPPFLVQVANNVRAVRPLPYRAKPAELFNTN